MHSIFRPDLRFKFLLAMSLYVAATFIWGWGLTAVLVLWFNFNIFLLRLGIGGILPTLIIANTFVFFLSKIASTIPALSQITGFAFYYFHLISTLIFVAKKSMAVKLDWVGLNLCLFYFPKIAAGPIVPTENFLGRLTIWNGFRRELAWTGINLFLIGSAKFFLLLPILDSAWRFLWGASGPTPFESALLVFCSALKLYLGFSGVVEMVRGISALIGIELPQNFNFPYLARNPQDFWMRWHITLTQWLTEHVFYPVVKKTRSIYLAIIFTISLMGLTHGGGWGFLLSGLYAGVGVVIYQMLRQPLAWAYCRLTWFWRLAWDYFFWIFNQAFMQFGLFLLIGSSEPDFLKKLQSIFFHGEVKVLATGIPSLVWPSLFYVLAVLIFFEKLIYKNRDRQEMFTRKDTTLSCVIFVFLVMVNGVFGSGLKFFESNFLYFMF